VALNRHSQAWHVGFMGLAVGFWATTPSAIGESTPQVMHQQPLRSESTSDIRTSFQAIDLIDYFKNYRSNSREFFHTRVCQVAKIAKFFTKLSTDLARLQAHIKDFESSPAVHR
jgi:hypothetical protein